MKRGLLFFLWISLNAAIGQLPPKTSYRIFTYSTENGLPSNGLKGMVWDEGSGFLWIATEAGLSRFNGIDFVNFTRSNTPFISSERMRFMTRNQAGQIRAADMEGNVFSISENHSTLLFSSSTQSTSWNNKLVGAAISDRVFSIDSIPSPSRIDFPFARVVPTGELSAMIVNQNGTISFLDLQKNTLEAAVGLGKDNAAGFVVNGTVFLQKREARELYRLDERSWQAIPTNIILPSTRATVFWEAGMDHPIAIEGDRAWLVKEDGKTIVFELICTDIPNLGLIKYVQYSAKRGLLFLGTVSRGFAVIRPNRVSQIRKIDFTPKDVSAYYAQWEWKPGSLLTNEGHVVGRSIPNTKPVLKKFGYSVYEDGDSLLWFSSGRKNNYGSVLQQLNRKTGERTYFNKVDIFNVYAFARWKSQILIGNNRGLGFLRGDSLEMIFPSSGPTSVDPIAYGLLELEPGIFSMTSCAGWITFDLNKRRADTLLSLPGYCVRTQTKIGDYVFIGTYGKGIYVYHRGKLTNVPLDKNGFLLYTHCFVTDQEGYVWMSTNRGLFKAAVADMIAAVERKANNIYYHYYGRNDGMEMTELNGGCSPCAVTLSTGTISFPSMDGLLWVDPQKATPLLPDGPIYLDKIQIDDSTINEAELNNSSIPRSHRLIRFRLGFSAWCNPENIYLEYQLNDTTSWIPLSVAEGPNIQLSNLSPGEYTLRIRKRNGFGENNFSVKTVSFRVGQAWYDHPLFYVFGVAGLIALIITFSRYQNRRLLKRQKELEELVGEKTRDLLEQNDVLEKNNRINTRLISIISHDIVTPLKFLTVAGKGLKENKDRLSEEEQKETLSDITQTAQELQLLSTNILNWIKYQSENSRLLPERVSPHEVTQQVFGVLSSLTKEKHLTLVNQIDKAVVVFQFAEPMKILIYNLVLNSIRYTDRGEVQVSVERTEKGFILSVKDQGIGMSEAKVESLLRDSVPVREKSDESRSGHGLGYQIIRDLVRWMQARLEIESAPGQGTEVRVFFESMRISPAEMV